MVAAKLPTSTVFPRKAVLAVHALLGAYALLLSYLLGGIVLAYKLPDGAFTALSFALLFFAFAQSLYEMGARRSLLFLGVTCVVGFVAELIGTATGVPFGKYFYTSTLGPQIAGVPAVIPFAWFVIAYVTFSQVFSFRPLGVAAGAGMGQRGTVFALVALVAFGTMSWDLMVDPMFTSYGYWVWQSYSGPTLSGVPLTNFLGWFVVSYLMVYIAVSLLPFFGGRGGRGGGGRTNGTGKTKKKKEEEGELAPFTPMKRHNLLDSRLVYLFLMVDGSVANLALGHYAVIVFGLLSMGAFFVLSYLFTSRSRERLIKEDEVEGEGGAASEAALR